MSMQRPTHKSRPSIKIAAIIMVLPRSLLRGLTIRVLLFEYITNSSFPNPLTANCELRIRSCFHNLSGSPTLRHGRAIRRSGFCSTIGRSRRSATCRRRQLWRDDGLSRKRLRSSTWGTATDDEARRSGHVATLGFDSQQRSVLHVVDVRQLGQIVAIHRLDQLGRDDEHQLTFILLKLLRTEEISENRNVAESGDLRECLSLA